MFLSPERGVVTKDQDGSSQDYDLCRSMSCIHFVFLFLSRSDVTVSLRAEYYGDYSLRPMMKEDGWR